MMNSVSLQSSLQQQLRLSANLLQSVEILQMNAQELLEYLSRVVEENPVLDQEDSPALQAAYTDLRREASWADGGGDEATFVHVSTKESVDLLRRAKAEGLPVTCETAPHYLVLCEDDLRDEGRFKMNPPLRSAADRDALREGLLDGTIDVIATDHV